MSINTPGYVRLQFLISHMIGDLRDQEKAIYERWHGRRFSEIEAGLESACANPRVRAFFDEYASGFAAQLEIVLPEGPLDEPGQAAIDYFEGLHTQTQMFAERVKSLSEQTQICVGLDESSPETEASAKDPLALAA